MFDLQPGVRTVVGLINVVGPEAARADFLAHLQTASGAPFEREAVLARIEKYVASRRGQGYYEAKVSLVDLPADNDRVNLTFTVDPGRHVRVVFDGDSFPGDKRELVPVEREGSVDEDLLEDSTARIEDALKSQGYKDARAPHERAESNGELVITFRVARGQQYRIARVTIDGNTSVPQTGSGAGAAHPRRPAVLAGVARGRGGVHRGRLSPLGVWRGQGRHRRHPAAGVRRPGAGRRRHPGP